VPSGRPETSSVAVYAGAESSVRRLVQGPPFTLRSSSTDWPGRSGSTVADTVTGSIRLTVPPLVGADTVTDGDGTAVERTAATRLCPPLSETAAR